MLHCVYMQHFLYSVLEHLSWFHSLTFMNSTYSRIIEYDFLFVSPSYENMSLLFGFLSVKKINKEFLSWSFIWVTFYYISYGLSWSSNQLVSWTENQWQIFLANSKLFSIRTVHPNNYNTTILPFLSSKWL
jgi:hypothetical protein